jgi:tetratricopeptide (TPR) repeat protein
MNTGDQINVLISKGIEAFQKKRYDEAIEAFQEAYNLAYKLNPDFPNNQEILNLIDMAKNGKSLLDKEYQAAANEARHRAEVMGIQVENVDQAIAGYAEALKNNPNDNSAKGNLANVYYIRGVNYTSKGEHAKAIADYSEAIKYEPNYPHALNKRGQEYSVNCDFDKAIADFEELLRLQPNNDTAKDFLAGAYLGRGAGYDKKGDYASAIFDFEKVLQLNPNNGTARELLEMTKAEMSKVAG